MVLSGKPLLDRMLGQFLDSHDEANGPHPEPRHSSGRQD